RRRCSGCFRSLRYGRLIPKSQAAFARDQPRGITNANFPSATRWPPFETLLERAEFFNVSASSGQCRNSRRPLGKTHGSALLRGVKPAKSSLGLVRKQTNRALVWRQFGEGRGFRLGGKGRT